MKTGAWYIKRILWIVCASFFVSTAVADDLEKITIDELKAMMNNPDVVIIDVRTSTDWSVADSKIQGAIREEPETISEWSEKYEKDTLLVFY